jgi:AcrR family transcriptional regulator
MVARTRTKQPNARKQGGLAGDGPARPRDAEVLKAAALVFSRRGYAAATVQDVADELGILKGSIYYYIKTKEDLLFRLLNNVHDEVDAILEQVVAIEGLDPLDRLCEYVRRQMTYNLRNLVQIAVYYNDLDHLSDARRAEILRRRKLHEDLVTNLIREAQKQGLIDEARDARLLAFNVFATLISPYRWFKSRGRLKLDDVVEGCVAFVRGGLTEH